MKYLLPFILSAFSLVAAAEPAANWVSIIEAKNRGVDAYYNANAIVRINETVRAGMFLFVFPSPTPFTINGQSVMARSVVKRVIVECEQGKSATVAEYYFSETRPGLTTVPLVATKIDPTTTLEDMTAKSILRQYMCGIQV